MSFFFLFFLFCFDQQRWPLPVYALHNHYTHLYPLWSFGGISHLVSPSSTPTPQASIPAVYNRKTIPSFFSAYRCLFFLRERKRERERDLYSMVSHYNLPRIGFVHTTPLFGLSYVLCILYVKPM